MRRVFSAVKWLENNLLYIRDNDYIIWMMKTWVLKFDGLEIEPLKKEGYLFAKEWIVEIEDDNQ